MCIESPAKFSENITAYKVMAKYNDNTYGSIFLTSKFNRRYKKNTRYSKVNSEKYVPSKYFHGLLTLKAAKELLFEITSYPSLWGVIRQPADGRFTIVKVELTHNVVIEGEFNKNEYDDYSHMYIVVNSVAGQKMKILEELL